MALEVDEQAPLFLFYERVHSTLDRLSQHAVSARSQGVGFYFIPSRMRKTYSFARTTDQLMVRCFGKIKHTELLITQWMTIDAIAVQDTCMGRQAGQYGRDGIAFRPVQNVSQSRPVRFVAQVRLPRFGPRHNHGVERVVQ